MGTTVQSSWADEIEEGDVNTLPMPTEIIKGNKKIITEYTEEDGKKVKKVRTFERMKKQVPRAVAQRKKLPKFGMSNNDRPGPDPATTVVAEEIFMNFVHNKDEHEKDEEKTSLDLLKESNKGVVRCRICKEDHWTTMCPYKDKIGLLKDLPGVGEDEKSPATPTTGGPPAAATGASAAAAPAGPGKYVPPGRRDARIGESMNDRKRSKYYYNQISHFLNHAQQSTLISMCVENIVEITENYSLTSLTHFFGKNFVKTTFLLIMS